VLARDHPAILERLEAGESRSVRAAAREARIVSASSGLASEASRARRAMIWSGDVFPERVGEAK
jgi:hypothetical protein